MSLIKLTLILSLALVAYFSLCDAHSLTKRKVSATENEAGGGLALGLGLPQLLGRKRRNVQANENQPGGGLALGLGLPKLLGRKKRNVMANEDEAGGGLSLALGLPKLLGKRSIGEYPVESLVERHHRVRRADGLLTGLLHNLEGVLG